MIDILSSPITANALLVFLICWQVFGKKYFDAYFLKKGKNRADKEDLGGLEKIRKDVGQPYDVELEKLKAQAAYIVEEYKETLKIRIVTKRRLYDGLTDLKVNTRKFYYRSDSVEKAQKAFDTFQESLEAISDFMSCNKHFIREIDPSFLTEFESQVNDYMKAFKAANDSINKGNPDKGLLEERNKKAEALLDLIDTYLEKIFFINPSEIPYNKGMQPIADKAGSG